jgi:hypothetical protein
MLRPAPAAAPKPAPPLPGRPATIGRTLVALALVVLVPVLAAFAAQLYLSSQQGVFDEQLASPYGATERPDMVTALLWSSEPDGPLYVGTFEGARLSIARNSEISRRTEHD